MIHYYGGHHEPITKVDVGIFIAMNIFWLIGWMITVMKWLYEIRKRDLPYGRVMLWEYRWDSMFLCMIDMIMCIFWVGVMFGVVGKFISVFL